MKAKQRCFWAGTDPVYIDYHDNEWGVPVHDDRKLFEFLILEGFQAGLSWITILKRREHFRKAFSNWDWRKIAQYTQKDIDRLLNDKGIIRNKLKVNAAVNNARRFIEVRKEFGSFDNYIWQFTNYQTLQPKVPYRSWQDVPASTPESDAMSKDLYKRGFKFVGPVICYAHMQATGMVNDHEQKCFRA
ncbi:MAG: DNA-3-methyladenine glycosylase I [Chitinivibrionales bacterium]|nr:DNA-3-methyladenine glycosylase I [Chitinivibrionales bacterium]